MRILGPQALDAPERAESPPSSGPQTRTTSSEAGAPPPDAEASVWEPDATRITSTSASLLSSLPASVATTIDLLRARFPTRGISVVEAGSEPGTWRLNVDGQVHEFSYRDGKFTSVDDPAVTLDSWISVAVDIPPEVADTLARLQDQGWQVQLLGASRDWPEGHFELIINGQQNAYEYSDGKFTQRSRSGAEPGAELQTLDTWTAIETAVPNEVQNAAALMRQRGIEVEILGPSRDWPGGHYELRVAGQQQNAYRYDNGRFVQQSNVEATPIVLDGWVDMGTTVPEQVVAAASALNEDGPQGVSFQLLGASREWPAGHYELVVDGVQNAYLFDPLMETFVQTSNIPDGGVAQTFSVPGLVVAGPDPIHVRPGDDVAAMIADAPEGASIVFAPGNYEVNATLHLKNDMTLIGDPAGTTLLGAQLLIGPDVSGVGIDRFTLDGSAEDSRETGVRCLGDNSVMSRLEVHGYRGHGINLHEAQNNTVTGCDTHHNGVVGIAMYDSDGNTIDGNRTSFNGAEGITVDHDSDYNTVSGNIVDSNCLVGGVGGIGIDWAEGNLILNNTVTGTRNSFAAITFQNNEGDSRNNTVSGNDIRHDGGPGIWLKYQEYPNTDLRWNSTGNAGPSPTYDNVVSENRISVSNSPQGAIIIDGSSSEALRQQGSLGAVTVVLSSGEVVLLEGGSLNPGNVLEDNRAA